MIRGAKRAGMAKREFRNLYKWPSVLLGYLFGMGALPGVKGGFGKSHRRGLGRKIVYISTLRGFGCLLDLFRRGGPHA